MGGPVIYVIVTGQKGVRKQWLIIMISFINR